MSTAYSAHGNVILGHIDCWSRSKDHDGGLNRLKRRLAELVFEREDDLTPQVLVYGADLVDLEVLHVSYGCKRASE